MESYLMMLYVTLEQESALKNFFVDHGWGFCKPDLSVTTDKLGPVVPNPPIPSEETSPPEADIPSGMTQTVPKIKNIPPSKPATETTSTVRRGKRRTKSPKHISTPSKQAKVVASIPVPEPSESNETLATEAVESMENETVDTNEIRAPITVQVADGNQFTIKIEQEFQEADNEKREVDNSDVVDNDDCDDGDDDNDEETNVDYTLEGASTSDADTSVKTENLSLGDNSMNVDTAAKDGPSGKRKRATIRRFKLKRYKAYSKSNLVDAYNMVKELGVPLQRAAKIFNVPTSTLTDRVKNRISLDVTKSGPSPVIGFEEEGKFTSHLNQLAEVGYGYTKAEIIRQASDYAIVLGKRTPDNPFSYNWYVSYVTRYPEELRVKPVLMQDRKTICTKKECVTQYYEKLNGIVHEYSLQNKPENIYVMDEIDIDLDKGAEEQCNTLTVIGAGNAVGQKLPPYFVMVKGLNDEDNPFMRKSQLITKGFKSYLSSHFIEHVEKRNESEPVLLLYDGHRSHLSVDLVEWAKSIHIIVFVIPPQESCIVKKRIGGVFEPLKSRFKDEATKQNQQMETSADVVSVVKNLYDNIVSSTKLQSWFKSTGIYALQDAQTMCSLLTSQKKLS